MRPIDADALKDKLQQHHDFYVMAWGGFGKMPIGEKKRVDEITNCIAEVVNAPTIEPKKGHWIYHPDDLFPAESTQECSVCHEEEFMSLCNENFCPNCGADMRKESD